MRPVPVLTYHHVNEHKGDMVTVTSEVFERQMRYLRDSGYRTLRAGELLAYINGGLSLDEKAVMVTFDDGWLQTCTDSVAKFLDRPPPAGTCAAETEPLCMNEFEVAMSVSNIHSSVGSDGLPLRAIVLLGDANRSRLLDFVNDCFRDGVFPASWKDAVINIDD